MKASKAEVLALIRDIGAGKKPWQPMRQHLIILGHMARKIEDQMGVDGRASFEELIACWMQMVRGGDAEARQILESLSDHPTVGEKVCAILALLPR
jgi:hypothetical protein